MSLYRSIVTRVQIRIQLAVAWLQQVVMHAIDVLRIWAALQHSRLSSSIHCQFTYYNTRKCEILKICDSFALSQLFLILFVGGNVSVSRVHFDHALTLSRDVVANKNSVSVLHTLEPQCVCIYHQNFLPLCRPINLPTGGHEKSAFFKQHVA